MKTTEQAENIFDSPAAKATKRWFTSEADFDAFVDKIINLAEETTPISQVSQPSLFGDIVNTHAESQTQGRDLRGVVSHAYLTMFEGMPEDHVVIKPELNAEFVNRCRLLGADVTEFTLNKTLLNVRKAGWHTGIERKRPCPLDKRKLDQISYGSEIAARLVQLYSASAGFSKLPTVDQIMCDPDLRSSFDRFVVELVPGHSSYEYRLAAFNFRKTGRASNTRLGHTPLPEWEIKAPMKSLDLGDVPQKAGLYMISSGVRPLFVSSTLNLHERICRHISFAEGRAFLPAEICDISEKKLNIQFTSQPEGWQTRKVEAVVNQYKKAEQVQYNLLSTAI